jgi:hypothetical protein
VLAVIPCVRYGYYNDWAMRASIPALFALQLLVARALSRAAVPAWARAGLAALLSVASLYPLSQLRVEQAAIATRGTWVRVPPRQGIPDLFEQQRAQLGADPDTPRYGFVEQYVASARAPFFQYLAGPLAPRTIVDEGPDSQGEDPAAPPAVTHSN